VAVPERRCASATEESERRAMPVAIMRFMLEPRVL
jgi:hypothetical protein